MTLTQFQGQSQIAMVLLVDIIFSLQIFLYKNDSAMLFCYV